MRGRRTSPWSHRARQAVASAVTRESWHPAHTHFTDSNWKARALLGMLAHL